MVEEGSAFWTERLLFRKYLIAHPDKMREYSTLKRELYTKHVADRSAYSDGKKNFVEHIIEKAKSAQ